MVTYRCWVLGPEVGVGVRVGCRVEIGVRSRVRSLGQVQIESQGQVPWSGLELSVGFRSRFEIEDQGSIWESRLNLRLGV